MGLGRPDTLQVKFKVSPIFKSVSELLRLVRLWSNSGSTTSAKAIEDLMKFFVRFGTFKERIKIKINVHYQELPNV